MQPLMYQSRWSSGDINPLRERRNQNYESIYLGLGNYGLVREDYAFKFR